MKQWLTEIWTDKAKFWAFVRGTIMVAGVMVDAGVLPTGIDEG